MQDPLRRRPGDRVVRRRRVVPVRINVPASRRSRPTRPITPLILAYVFASLIGLGTLLLSLPISSADGTFTGFIPALFTATSAATVTGLVVADTPTFWSPFGKAVILVLMQVGGLGFMTTSTLLFIVLGRRIGLRERLALRLEAGSTTLGGIVRLLKRVGLAVAIAEAVGFIAFSVRFAFDMPIPSALWHGLFHAVSAFNNAGFVVLPGEGLDAYRGDASVLLITAGLVILGAISIAVLSDLTTNRSFKKLSLDTKVVLSATAFLMVVGFIIVLVSEYSNPDSLGPMGIPGKLLSAFFESASARTAGFSSLNPASFTQSTLFFIMGLMFIGGASGSTAGGIKVNTFAIIMGSVIATMRGRPHVEAFKREIPDYQVSRALTIGVVAVAFTLTVLLALTLLEDARFIELLFEAVSAFGANGYSTGLPSRLTEPGQFILAFTMFVGRIGPLTLILTLAQRPEASRYRYGQERLRIG